MRQSKKPQIEEDRGHFKVFFPLGFSGYDEEAIVLYDIAKKAEPTDRCWFWDGEKKSLKYIDDEFSSLVSNAVNWLIEKEVQKYSDISLRQGFFDGMMYTHVGIHVSKEDDAKSTIIMQSEIEAIDAKRDIAQLDLYIDGQMDYTICEPQLLEETDTHVTIRFKKDV